jgi:hypothetical protein
MVVIGANSVAEIQGDNAEVRLWLFILTTIRVTYGDGLLLFSIKCLINVRQSYYLLITGAVATDKPESRRSPSYSQGISA